MIQNTWFGKKPWSRMCQGLEKVPTPVGEECLHCDEVITAQDEGEMMVQSDGTTARWRPIHRECLIRSVIGSRGHQKGLCSCYGGTEEDPEGMTKREAALAACFYFEATNETLYREGQ